MSYRFINLSQKWLKPLFLLSCAVQIAAAPNCETNYTAAASFEICSAQPNVKSPRNISKNLKLVPEILAAVHLVLCSMSILVNVMHYVLNYQPNWVTNTREYIFGSFASLSVGHTLLYNLAKGVNNEWDKT
jgi:hypothetical protein